MLILRSLVCAMLWIALAPAALAHARVVRSAPAKGETLSRSPERIEVWFNELLDEGFNTIEIFPAAEIAAAKRTNLAKENPIVDSRDRTHLILKTAQLAPGEYVVEWRVLSRDGHSAPGRFTFRISDR
ncbi:MAG: copper resistance CopC family protein [Chthoniobacteraceae bacterium]